MRGKSPSPARHDGSSFSVAESNLNAFNFSQQENGILVEVSLRTRILVLVVTVTVSVAMVVGFANFIQASSMSRNAARAELRAETRIIAANIKRTFQISKDQALILRNTPPIRGIMRARANSGVDPNDEIGALSRAFVDMTRALQQNELSANTFETMIDGLLLLSADGAIRSMTKLPLHTHVLKAELSRNGADEFISSNWLISVHLSRSLVRSHFIKNGASSPDCKKSGMRRLVLVFQSVRPRREALALCGVDERNRRRRKTIQ